MITGIKLLDGYTGNQQKKILPENAQAVYERPAYPGISHKAECRVYQETECGMKNCCFECMKRFVCKEFEGVCGEYTKATYKNCPERKWEYGQE